MKPYKRYLSIVLASAFIVGCHQEIAELRSPEAPSAPTGAPGSADFAKFVAIGNSLTAGLQSGALFTEGQQNSLAAILHKQFTYVGGGQTFNQPDINSVNGFNATSSNPGQGLILGRLVLFDPDGPGPRTAGPVPAGSPARTTSCPAEVTTPALPAPYNTADLPTPYTGDKTKLNNFGVPGILLGQVLTPLTGGPASGNPAFNPYYARFASNPGVSTIIGDAVAANPTFFMFFLGNNDVLGYATTGASGAIAMTSVEAFTMQYNGAIATLLGNVPGSKGVVGNIPDVTSIPFFFTVRYNSPVIDAATATSLNTGFAGYNQVLDALKGAPFNLPAADVDARKVNYTAGPNPVLIKDETLMNYGPLFDGLLAAGAINGEQRARLALYEQVRQATPNDLLTLSAGSILGTCFNNNPQLINGLSVPLDDQFVLIPSETLEIKTRTAEFNAIIAQAVANSGDRLALADVNGAFNQFVATQGAMINGIMLTPSITPPYAGFSEDGVHPNGRGSAFLANIFIDAINQKFGASIPKADITKFRGTRTPVTPNSTY